MNKRSAVSVVIPAAGIGKRMGADVPKQYLQLHGKTVLEHSIACFADHASVERVIVSVASHDQHFPSIRKNLPAKCSHVIGGKERCHSVLAGLEALAGDVEDDCWIMVHDAARPCLRSADIDSMIATLNGDSIGGILAVPARDTLKRCDDKLNITETVDRTHIWQAMTPQMFRLGKLRDAIKSALEDGVIVTDEAQAIERLGFQTRVVQGHADNIKITHPEDLALASAILESHQQT